MKKTIVEEFITNLIDINEDILNERVIFTLKRQDISIAITRLGLTQNENLAKLAVNELMYQLKLKIIKEFLELNNEISEIYNGNKLIITNILDDKQNILVVSPKKYHDIVLSGNVETYINLKEKK